MSNQDYVYELGGGEVANWVVDQLAGDLDNRDATIASLTAERNSLRKALEQIGELPYLDEARAIVDAALRQGDE